MGREIIVQARAFNKKKSTYEIVFEQYVCGRDDATEYVANLCCNAWRNVEEPEEYDSHDSSPDWTSYSSLVFDIDVDADRSKLSDIITNLDEYGLKDKKEIQKAKDELNDLLIARRNARNLDEFVSFGDEIERVRDWIDNEDFSRAGNLVAYLKIAKSTLEKLDSKKYNTNKQRLIKIIWSE